MQCFMQEYFYGEEVEGAAARRLTGWDFDAAHYVQDLNTLRQRSSASVVTDLCMLEATLQDTEDLDLVPLKPITQVIAAAFNYYQAVPTDETNAVEEVYYMADGQDEIDVRVFALIYRWLLNSRTNLATAWRGLLAAVAT